jgi:hypothetical protein
LSGKLHNAVFQGVQTAGFEVIEEKGFHV